MTLPAFHTHCTFCDGKNTAEEMVLKAIELGCEEIGFSSHSPLWDYPSWCMTEEGTEKYKSEILRLKDKYFDRIKIYLGIEYDYYTDIDTSEFDYIIGSVHRVEKNGVYITVDNTLNDHKKGIAELYGGDKYAFVEDYYKLMGDIYNKTGCDIVGHFDVITKFNEQEYFYDVNSPRYKEAVFSSLDSLKNAPVTFEVNTGAISRGYRTTPYLEDYMLDRIAEMGKGLVITPDTHSADTLLFGMEECGKSLKEKGYAYFTSMEEIKNKKITKMS